MTNGTPQQDHGLGRLYRADPRDANFRMAAVVPRRSTKTVQYWNDRWWWGNQGSEPQCVAYSSMHFLADGPITHGLGKMPFEEPALFFQAIGGTPDGALVRDGMKRLQKLGAIGSYHWATTMNEVEVALLERGPVIIGIEWTEAMFAPDGQGIIKPGGDVAGGHAILINGINRTTGLFRLKNSWGRDWGKTGRCFLRREDLEFLLFGANGEAVIPTELNV